MDKRYLLYKFCSNGTRKCLTWLTATNMHEANQAVVWLKKHHPDDPDLNLEEGEFFEILEEETLSSNEWQAAMDALAARKKSGFTQSDATGENKKGRQG